MAKHVDVKKRLGSIIKDAWRRVAAIDRLDIDAAKVMLFEQAIEDSRSNDLLEENKRLAARIAELEAVGARRDVVIGRLRADITVLVELDRAHRRLFDRRFAWCRPPSESSEKEISDEMVFSPPSPPSRSSIAYARPPRPPSRT